MNERIYKRNIVKVLQELADKDYQKNIWLNTNNPHNLVGSFVEAANVLFDDCVIKDYLDEGQIIISKAVTHALRELDIAVTAVDEFRPEEAINNDPLMQVVREKAARCLALIETSDGSESTVEIIE